MISPKDLANLQAELMRTLTQRCTIIHRSFVSDGAGGQTESTTTTPDVPCCVLTTSTKATETLVVAGIECSKTVTILLPATVSISHKDTITVDAVSYEVIGLDSRTNRVLQQIECTRIY
ncbi:MAG: head-tail adaptor protein [Armatimonadota bacterium]